MTERGRTSSTLRSCAPRGASASTEISMPGAIAPPRYSPLADTASKLVAVPKSTTMHGPPYSVMRGERVDDAVGADLLGVVGEHRHAGAHAGLDDDRRARRRSSGGTSRASRAAPTAPWSRARCRRRRRRSARRAGRAGRWSTTAISSAVRRASVSIRQCSTRSSPVEQAEHGVGVADVDGEQHQQPPPAGRSAMSRTGAEWVSAPTAR